ncbi:cell division protein ZapE [Idiomarina xiamenensis]|nr:cell division protein ZapE [Idiomarina xiamenensis]
MQKYHADLARGDFHKDAAQAEAVAHLQRLYDQLLARHQWHQRPAWQRWFKQRPKTPQGLYFWGGVGRGKTYLVDTFYEALPIERKWRIHFHRFMHRVHEELKTLANKSDPLVIVAERIAAEAEIICFDEFFVQDITDAMILGTLMQQLFARGVVLVATSNIVPDDLYKNGLQRARFLPAIALIKQHCDVVNVDSGVDYRLRTLTQAAIYHTPANEKADQQLFEAFFKLAPDHQSQCENGDIKIAGRKIAVRCLADDVIFFTFQAICGGPRSQLDYMEIARLYSAVLISDVVSMGAHNDDTARRFIALVDEFYERKVKLVMSAAVPLEQLYGEGQLSFEFRRCVSRLKEMQSHEYLAQPHLP